MDYEITATLGPSSASESMWESMIAAGVTAFRLNTSHLSVPELHRWLDRLRLFFSSHDSSCPLVLDLQGSKWRLGDFPPFELIAGSSLELICADSTARPGKLPVPHPDFFAAAADSSGEIVLNDGKVQLKLESTGPDWLRAAVLRAGELSPRKGITISASGYRKESLCEKDQAIFAQTNGLDFIRYALSYVKDSIEMSRYRELFGAQAYLIAKIERQPAAGEAFQIAQVADELWLCRGDLGAELGIKAMAEEVRRFSALPGSLLAPVLMAGQVLEHMSEHPSPTRSEVCHLLEVLDNGYRGVVLSDETAIGRYPLESCRVAALFR